MTWHAGVTLETRLKAGHRFSVPEVQQLGIRLAKALGALHRRGIIHRDIKPANLHLGDDGELRILDLGVAHSGDQPRASARGRVGTPSFLAPELFAGAEAGTQCDLYAAGVTLYYLLTRQYPYGEIEPFQHPRFGEPTPPTRYRPDLPGWLESILLKGVARDPRQRFETAEELLLALERGAYRPLAPPPPTPLAARAPLALWRAIGVVSIVINLLLLYLFALLR
jgi:protein phosphatase